ncbi:MAG: S1C family serine protease [Ignisphaera sp.]|uniref:Serine protease n=1 Tax=Ignisphaera aggregans TaxID=334771 RepID=A0A7J3JPY5_9CREN
MGIVKRSIALDSVSSMVGLKLIEGELKKLIANIIDSTVMVLIPRDRNATCIEVAKDNRYLDCAATGFYIDNRVVVTVMHSIQHVDSERICILDLDGDIVEGEIMDVDPKWDLMFISSVSDHSPIPLKDSTASIGDFVIACGTAYGLLRPFLSVGIVSGSEVKADAGYGLIEGLLLVSLPILSGMSGSPIVDLDGTAVGMIMAKAFDANEFSLAIPSTRILYGYRILKKYGRIAHIVLGVSVLALRGMITALGLQHGLVISRILNPNILKFCKLNDGDVLLSINDREMRTIEDLRLALDETLLNNGTLTIEYLSRMDKKVYSCTIDELTMFTSPRPFQ